MIYRYMTFKSKINIEKKEVKTKVRKPNNKLNTMITTIPSEIVNLLELTPDNNVIWTYKVSNGSINLDIRIE